jgi:hypothetical protein
MEGTMEKDRKSGKGNPTDQDRKGVIITSDDELHDLLDASADTAKFLGELAGEVLSEDKPRLDAITLMAGKMYEDLANAAIYLQESRA